MLDTFEGSNGTGGEATVVTPLHHRVDSIDAQYSNTGVFLKWKNLVIILQQHHTLSSHVESQLLVGVTGHDTFGNLRPGIQVIAVEISQFEAGNEQTAQTLIEVSLFHLATTYGLWQILVFRSALNIRTSQYGLG